MQEFLNMGGYAFFVWASFGFGLVCLMYLFFAAKSSYKKNVADVAIWQTRENKKRESR